jgi:hypothetical protein
MRASMSDFVMFSVKDEFKLRHFIEGRQPSSELTISSRTTLNHSNSAAENLLNFLFHRGEEKTNKVEYF